MGEILESIMIYLFNIPTELRMIFAVIITFVLVSKSYDKLIRAVYTQYRRKKKGNTAGDVRSLDLYKDAEHGEGVTNSFQSSDSKEE